MTDDSGYTLVEMLAALAVIGMTFGGLSAGISVLARNQTAATTRIGSSENLIASQASLEAALTWVKSGDILAGTTRRLELKCSRGDRCEAAGGLKDGPVSLIRTGGDRVEGIAATGYDFGYVTSGGLAQTWSAEGDDRLLAIVLRSNLSGAAVAVMRFRQEQSFRCEYDVVIASCREPAA